MRIIWNITGDSIDLDILLPEVFEYYLEHQANQFYVTNPYDHRSKMDELLHNIDIINTYLVKLKQDVIQPPAGYSQTDLGRIHAQWVSLHKKYPRIDYVCKRFDDAATIVFYDTNKIIHALEESFVAVVDNRSGKDVPNPFGNHIFSWGNSNIQVEFANLGRTTFNRYLNFATTEWEDTNNFEELWGKLRINLNRPYDQSVPKQYKDWCRENKEQPVGEKILLANFRDLEKNLSTYRQMWVNNMALDGNYIFFAS
jgi:hypothetical protein